MAHRRGHGTGEVAIGAGIARLSGSLYCFNDFRRVMDALRDQVTSGHVVQADPATVAAVWGRVLSRPPLGAPRNTTTSVRCGTGGVGGTVTCRATVTGTDDGIPVAPAGPVVWSSAAGTLSSGSCTLSGVRPSTSCTVSFTPPSFGAVVHASYRSSSASKASAGSRRRGLCAPTSGESTRLLPVPARRGVTGITRLRPLSRRLLRLAVILSSTSLFACTSAPSTVAPSTPGSSAASASSRGPIEVTGNAEKLGPPPGGSFLVRGSYPRVRSRCKHQERESLGAWYPGTLSIGRAADGSLTVTVTLPFERYLEGIAEVPPSWPMAALEAQAIAARSYALASTGWNGSQGQTLRTPICASTSCQVYRGIPVPSEPAVHRWVAAVRRTTPQVLLYGGRPADTVYFSTSNGRTYGNDQVFGSAPLPYLRPVVERDDGASPESHWRTRLRLVDLATFLRTAAEWPKGHAISSVRRSGSAIVVSGGGASRSIQQGTFIDAVNTWAPCLDPSRYPPRGPAGTLPSTIPSRWFTVSPSKGGVVVTGRGWGHGAGMVQWGAYGKARRGLSASQILAYYYGGLRPRRFPEPGLIHVLVASGLTSLRVTPSAPGATLDGHQIDSSTLLVTGGVRITVTQRSD